MSLTALLLASIGLAGCHGDGEGGLVFQFNMAGRTEYGGSTLGVTHIMNSINARDPKPVFVTVQEVCGQQLPSLQSALRSAGYEVVLSFNQVGYESCDVHGPRSEPGDGNDADNWFGHLVASRLDLTGGTRVDLSEPAGREARFAVCGRAHSIYANPVICGVHYINSMPSTAAYEANEVFDWMAVRAGPWIVSGDHNLDSCWRGVSYFPDINTFRSHHGYTELDGDPVSVRSTMRNTYGNSCTSSGNYFKLDHIWLKGYSNLHPPARISLASVSDHSIYEGFIQ